MTRPPAMRVNMLALRRAKWRQYEQWRRRRKLCRLVLWLRLMPKCRLIADARRRCDRHQAAQPRWERAEEHESSHRDLSARSWVTPFATPARPRGTPIS